MNKKVSEKDKKNWQNFISNKEKLINKDLNLTKNQIEKEIVKTIDLHGFSLSDANKTVYEFIKKMEEIKVVILINKLDK